LYQVWKHRKILLNGINVFKTQILQATSYDALHSYVNKLLTESPCLCTQKFA